MTQHEEHVHDVWNTSVIDLKVRKVCGACNGGWMSEIEVAAMPILRPLIPNVAPAIFTEPSAVTLATWVVKTALTASLVHPDDTNPVSGKYFDELFRRRAPLVDSVVWIAAYEVGRYPVSSSMMAIPDVNGFRVTGNVGCFAYQVAAGDDMAEGGVVLPPDELAPYLSQIWPLQPRADLAAILAQAWPGTAHLGRLPVAMNDAGLRYLSQVPNHSWGLEFEQPPEEHLPVKPAPTRPKGGLLSQLLRRFRLSRGCRRPRP